MKLLMVLVPSDCLNDLQKVIEGHEIHAYTEVPNVLGAGTSGRKLGTRAFPGTAAMILTILRSSEASALVDAVREFAAERDCREEIRVFGLPAEQLV